MLACYAGMLQILSSSCTFLSVTEALGVAWTSEDSAAGAVGGANGDAAGAGCEFGSVRAGYS